ncbi:hypothetical protein C8Q80DRAFT_1265782 [Daedaleopsis nitida]|nr:hypothetical protein C8Q80DRAFT_1265782 [Daedaleopsis nitida]
MFKHEDMQGGRHHNTHFGTYAYVTAARTFGTGSFYRVPMEFPGSTVFASNRRSPHGTRPNGMRIAFTVVRRPLNAPFANPTLDVARSAQRILQRTEHGVISVLSLDAPGEWTGAGR